MSATPSPAGGRDADDTGFRGGERLRTDAEYREVVHKGERTNTPHFTVYRDHREAALSGRKIGISVGKRVGGAVVRNRVKRLLREFYRRNKGAFPPGSRTAIVARKAPGSARLSDVSAELLPAIERRWGKKGGPPRCGQDTSSSPS